SAILDSQNPANMSIQLGTDNVSCSTDIYNKFPGQGTFVYFSVDKMTPGSNPSQEVDVIVSSSRSIDITGGPGMATVTSIDTRVMGSVSFTYTDSTTGKSLDVSGTFDVKKCF